MTSIRLWCALTVVTCGLGAPAEIFAQTGASGIAGIVRDSSGGVLPGVTVEASSPALIEKSRSVVSDGTGQYRIVDLRPGVYTVTFTLQGFNAFRREDIELPANFTATVNADLTVGAVEETVTVTGASPVVDVQNTQPRSIITSDTLDTLPTAGKALTAFVALIPGLAVPANAQDVGGNKGELSVRVSIHGGRANQMRWLQDGMEVTSSDGAGSGHGFYPNPASTEEVSVDLGGGPGEANVGAVQLNYVPKTGGNTFTGLVQLAYANENFQSDNLTSDLMARGLTTVNPIERVYDYNFAAGGPVLQDRLWFFTAHRTWGNSSKLANVFENRDVRAMIYEPDRSRQAVSDFTNRAHNLRLTTQPSQRNRVSLSFDLQDNCDCHRGIENAAGSAGNTSPEAAARRVYVPNNISQATWSFPVSNRLLFEAGGMAYIFSWRDLPEPGVTFDMNSILEQSTNFRYRAAQIYTPIRKSSQMNGRASMSYITGTHHFKTGLFWHRAWRHHTQQTNGVGPATAMTFTFNQGRPTSVTQYAEPIENKDHTRANIGIYAQDQWTINKLTLSLAARYDHLAAVVPAHELPAGPYVPARSFPEVDCVPCWHDFSPRVGAAYDLWGNGKTAVKFSVGKYVASEQLDLARANDPVVTTVSTVSRSWTDPNGDFIPQASELGPPNNSNFGRSIVSTRYSDDVLLRNRQYSWQWSAGIQHELLPRVALNVSYYRTTWHNHRVTDNLAVTPADYDPFCITAPVDPRMPGGGGNQLCGFYNIKNEVFSSVNNLIVPATNFGARTEVFNGVDVTVNARLGGAQFGGGVSTGKTRDNDCVLIDSPQVIRPGFCNTDIPFSANTQLKLNGSYALPYDFQVSAAFQNIPGLPILASYVATNAEVRPTLGRALSGSAANVTLDAIIAPGLMYEPRITQLDARLTRTFRYGRTRLQANFDLYNLFNASSVLAMNTRFGPQWLQPSQIMGGRLLKLSGQVSF